jgi:hypothetical protein
MGNQTQNADSVLQEKIIRVRPQPAQNDVVFAPGKRLILPVVSVEIGPRLL